MLGEMRARHLKLAKAIAARGAKALQEYTLASGWEVQKEESGKSVAYRLPTPRVSDELFPNPCSPISRPSPTAGPSSPSLSLTTPLKGGGVRLRPGLGTETDEETDPDSLQLEQQDPGPGGSDLAAGGEGDE